LTSTYGSSAVEREMAGLAGPGWVDIGSSSSRNLVVRGSTLVRPVPRFAGSIWRPLYNGRWLGARGLPFYLDRKQISVKRPLTSLDQVDNLETLKRVVLAAEQAAGISRWNGMAYCTGLFHGLFHGLLLIKGYAYIV
jgi:hypothetical protein